MIRLIVELFKNLYRLISPTLNKVNNALRPYLIFLGRQFDPNKKIVLFGKPIPNATVFIFGLFFLTAILWSIGLPWFKWVLTGVLVFSWLLWEYLDWNPLKWGEMTEREKLGYVRWNGTSKLTKKQLKEYYKILEKNN